MQKFQSEKEVLKSEINSSYTNVIGSALLKEELNFQNYNKLFGNYIRKPNIKNINFFKKDNAPLTFGKSGNIEILEHRRYEFLAKYDTDNFNLPNKYIWGVGGLWWNKHKWCSVLNKKDTVIIIPTGLVPRNYHEAFQNRNKLIHCEDIN